MSKASTAEASPRSALDSASRPQMVGKAYRVSETMRGKDVQKSVRVCWTDSSYAGLSSSSDHARTQSERYEEHADFRRNASSMLHVEVVHDKQRVVQGGDELESGIQPQQRLLLSRCCVTVGPAPVGT